MTRPVGADFSGRDQAIEARPRSQVEDHLARLESREGLRVAAREAEVCPVGQCGQFIRRVAESDGKGLGVLGAAAQRSARSRALRDFRVAFRDNDLEQAVFHGNFSDENGT